jgi:hypothetical protein
MEKRVFTSSDLMYSEQQFKGTVMDVKLSRDGVTAYVIGNDGLQILLVQQPNNVGIIGSFNPGIQLQCVWCEVYSFIIQENQ